MLLMMNGAESLVRTLVHNQVKVCFTNPGTSEMHFVAALDTVPGIRCVLGLFEGVVTGAADGYYRLAQRPAATLLHLGPGLGNGLANLHNARKANSGIVNIVGEHATHHLAYDAPLTADIEGVARPMSHWVHTSRTSQGVAQDGAHAITQARTAPGRIATLILPADTAWNPGGEVCTAEAPESRAAYDAEALEAAARALESVAPNAGRCAILLGGVGALDTALTWAGRIAARTGCAVLGEYNVPRTERGAGRVHVFDADLVHVATWGVTGLDSAQLRDITALAVAPDGRVFVTCAATRYAVQVFQLDGMFVTGFGRHELGPGNFSLPSGLAFMNGDRVCVSDAIRQIVQVFGTDGTFVGTFGGVGIGLAIGVAIRAAQFRDCPAAGAHVGDFLLFDGDLGLELRLGGEGDDDLLEFLALWRREVGDVFFHEARHFSVLEL
ncbi:MAG: hypothetical protein RL442_1289, partial [Pseudomonadota bacterium]